MKIIIGSENEYLEVSDSVYNIMKTTHESGKPIVIYPGKDGEVRIILKDQNWKQ